jgi:hypothetical protein
MFYLVDDGSRRSEIIEGLENVRMYYDEDNGPWTYKSFGYETIELLIEGEGVQLDPCKMCGTIYSADYIEPTRTELIERGECFFCNFWYNLSVKDKTGDPVIINKSHYQVGPDDDSPESWKGHGGRLFKIQMNDGRIVETNNLWSQGDIPDHIIEHCGEVFHDNAVFI